MTLLGSYTISVPVGVVSSVRLRLRNAYGVGPASVAKQATPTNGTLPSPAIEEVPLLSSAPLVGVALSVQPGVWFNAETLVTSVLLDGVPVELPYTLQASDDGATLVIRETATGPGGQTTFTTDPIAVTYPAPALDVISDVSTSESETPVTVQATGSDLVGGVWSISGSAAAAIDQAGLVTLDVSETISNAVTVSYANSGGVASRTFFLSVAGVGAAWTPADLVNAAFVAVDFTNAASLTLDAGNVAAATGAYGSTYAPKAVIPAPYDAANGALDLSASPGEALTGSIPFIVSGPRDSGGAGDDLVDGLTLIWVGSGMTQGVAAGFGTSLSRQICGAGNVFGVTANAILGTAWKDGAPHLFTARVRLDQSAADTWLDGAPLMVAQSISSTSQKGMTSDKLSIGDMWGGGAASDGKLHFVMALRGVISEIDRQKLEGWAAWSFAALGADGSALPEGHPYKAAAPVAGVAPQPAAALPSLSLYQNVWIEPLDLRPYWTGWTSFEGVSLPAGLSVSGHHLIGKPTSVGSGSYVLRATNANGSADRMISISVAGAPAGSVATTDALWASAAATSVGGTITLSDTLTSAADPTLATLTALTGDTTATLVGFTDFRDGAPVDLDYDSRRPVSYFDAEGAEQTTAATGKTVHPMFGNGDWVDASAVSTALPLDHLPGGAPAGLALGPNLETRLLNGFGHNGRRHDGHIVWVAEYEMADGSTLTAWEEYDNTRGANPRLPIRHAARNAARLRRFATFQIASHAALKNMEIWETDDCRRWVTPAKLRRGDFGDPTPLADMTALNAAIEALPVQPGAQALALAAATWTSISFSTAAKTRLAAIRDAGGRVILMGRPGETIVSSALVGDCHALTFAWMTFARVDVAAAERDAIIGTAKPCEVAFHGCVIDAIGDSTAGVTDLSAASRLTFADCYIAGYNGPSTSSGVSTANMPRFRVTRCICDFANDGASIYGAGSVRLESCYYIGSGGAWRNNGFLHADIGGQYNASSMPQQQWIALYDNIFDQGPNAFIPDTFRAAPSMQMNQYGQKRCYDVVGNIFVQPVINGGFSRTSYVRRPENGEALTSSWWSNVHVAHNLWLYRPDLVQPGWTYPFASIDGLSSPPDTAIDNYIATGNLLMTLNSGFNTNSPALQASFDRTFSMFPEEAGSRTLDASTALASFPAVSGTWDGGYALDWSGTTYAGTSREGFIAPEDCVLSVAARAWGTSPVRGLPHDAAYIAANFTGLPADIRSFLGFVDAHGDPIACGYGPDWFGGYAPTPGAISATLADPWGAGADGQSLVVNCRIGTLAAGTIIEEVDATDPDKTWRLDVVQEGSDYFPRFTATDAAGAVTHRVTSARPLSANAHLLATVSTRFRACFIESFMISERVAQIIWDHYQRSGEKSELSIVFEAANSAPTVPAPTPGSKEIFLWADGANANAVRIWDGSAWSPDVPKNLCDMASLMFVEEHRKITKDAGAEEDVKRLFAATFGPMKWRLTLVESLPHALVHAPAAPSATNGYGDRLWAARSGSYSKGYVAQRWNGTEWINYIWGSNDVQPQIGDVSVALAIDGKASARRADAIWSNLLTGNPAPGVFEGTDATLARGSVRIGGDCAIPYKGTLGFVEARRLSDIDPTNGTIRGPLDGAVGSVIRTMRRAPVDAATGARDHPVLGPAEVWRLS